MKGTKGSVLARACGRYMPTQYNTILYITASFSSGNCKQRTDCEQWYAEKLGLLPTQLPAKITMPHE